MLMHFFFTDFKLNNMMYGVSSLARQVLTSRQHIKVKNTHEKTGAQASWSRSILDTTALLDLGCLGYTCLSSRVYHK